MSRTGFKEPNFTQVPNDLFKYMDAMSNQELRVLLALIRLTFGYHRTKVRASITKLQEMTGLSRQGVINGANMAEDRGLVTKITGNGVNQWVVNVVDQQLVNVVDRSSQRGRPPSIKENIKQSYTKKKDYSGGPYSDSIVK